MRFEEQVITSRPSDQHGRHAGGIRSIGVDRKLMRSHECADASRSHAPALMEEPPNGQNMLDGAQVIVD